MKHRADRFRNEMTKEIAKLPANESLPVLIDCIAACVSSAPANYQAGVLQEVHQRIDSAFQNCSKAVKKSMN